MANFVSYANATELMTEIGNKFKAIGGAYIPRGNSTFANLPTTLTAAMLGYVYNVTDAFTSTALFAEGAGKKYPAGSNVVVVNLGTTDTPDLKYDVLAGFIDVDVINDRIDSVSAMITTAEFSTASAYAIGDIVKYEDGLYQFTAAHTAGNPWNASEVTAINILDLVIASAPDSLTAAQVEALIALL